MAPSDSTKPTTKPVSMIGVAIFSCFLFVVVSITVGILVVLLAPPKDPASFYYSAFPLPHFGFSLGIGIDGTRIGIGTEPWNLPGTIIGLVVAISTFLLVRRAARRDEHRI